MKLSRNCRRYKKLEDSKDQQPWLMKFKIKNLIQTDLINK